MFSAFQQEQIRKQSENEDFDRDLVYKPIEEMEFEELNNELKYFFCQFDVKMVSDIHQKQFMTL